ncbi:hypothetical protein [Rufibacter psychrotolerans]|uniref:hypothetical protein n=1 Tax=Rufibacter psychrotolerans TaxID=2812556 RepID=UPI00196821E9|nr:hypothetical protein [Rufibacter sp. SYSU D00308]
MDEHYNLLLRVAAYNRQFKNIESKIFLNEGTNPNEASNYTSLLYERYLSKGAILEVKNGLFLFYWKLIHPAGIFIRGLNFLQVLAYLEYYDELRNNKIKEAMAILKEYNEREKANNNEEKKGFELEERDGVTFIKNTNFVISKIM